MFTDRQGNSLSGATAKAAEHFDEAVYAFNIYRGDPVGPLDRAIEEAPEFAMGYIAKAYLYATSSEPAAMGEARALNETAGALAMNDRERGHVAALKQLLDGEWSRAAVLLERLTAEFPRDLLALQSGHLVDFYRASARSLRDRIAGALPKWSPEVPGYSILLGMHAFGLEECGEYARAEDSGRQALAMEPLDCWAHHAVTHVMEMLGRAEDGIGWMVSREPHWSGDDNSFKVHNWWHRALFHLELGQAEAALTLYDGPIRSARSAVALDLVDASALLWRLQLCGVDVGARWDELAATWEGVVDGRTYPFNDWHAVMAFVGAGRAQDTERVVASLRDAASGDSEVNRWARQFALPLVEGFISFSQGDYRNSLDLLYGVRDIANAFGGSHAQRDIVDWTLLEAALRGGSKGDAQALAAERGERKPHTWLTREFARRAAG